MSGIDSYIVTDVEIFFTGDTVCCDRCPLLETYARKQCRRTGEYILDSRFKGRWCPLIIKGEDEDEHEDL